MNKTKTREGDSRLVGVPGRYWHKLEDGRIQCDLCPRFCKLREGQRGVLPGQGQDQPLSTAHRKSEATMSKDNEQEPTWQRIKDGARVAGLRLGNLLRDLGISLPPRARRTSPRRRR